MYQSAFSKQIRVAIGAGAVALVFGAAAAGAQDVDKCRREILKRSQKLASTAMKSLQKCEEGRFKGKITTTCAADAKTQDKINKAATLLADKVADKCASVTLADVGFAGAVTRCTGGNAAGDRCVTTQNCRFPPASTGPEDGTCDPVDECPGFLNGADGCEFALTGIAAAGASNDVVECVQCITRGKVETVVDTYYGILKAPSDDKDVQKCQIEIGKRAGKYFDAVEKTLKKCEDANIKDATAVVCTTDPDGKIAKALTKLDDKILDGCDTAEKINLAIKPGELYARAGRYGSCGTTAPGTAQGLADALECVTESSAACDVAMNVGDHTCGPQLCGNGQIDAGESCDDGNTLNDSGVGPADVCPADCAVAECTDAGDDTVTVSFATPGGIALYGLTVVVTYNDAKVRIPGSGGDLAVQTAVTSLSFGMTPNDTDYALRNVLSDPFLTGVTPGAAFDIAFDTCQGAGALAAGDVQCIVVDAVDTSFATVDGVTCSVTL